ncbi:MAG: NifU family protein [Flavobacteriales bacterium]
MSSLSLHERVERALADLRPYLEADGGDIRLVNITPDKRVLVELHGACADCSMIHMTMKGGVEQAVKAAAPEIVGIEAVNLA